MKINVKRGASALLAALLALTALSGCGKTSGDETEPVPTPPAVTSQPEPTGNPEQPDGVLAADKETVKSELISAIKGLTQPPVMDISGAGLENPEMDVRNIYYMILSDYPEMKYAYDISVEVSGGLLSCRFSYMPYKTGTFPEGFQGLEVSSLEELIDTAEANLGAEPVSIRIMDSSFDTDVMNWALQQAGGAFINCVLSSDATQITFSPPYGMTMDEALAALEETGRLADEVIAQVLTEDMTEFEKAQALYSHITERVKYDHRYYSDKASMPYISQTALGALRDDLAICGGYSNAVKLLFEKVGIKCWNVSGKPHGENHMWSVAKIDGEWLYCDATADRGLSADSNFGLCDFAMEELDPGKYEFDISRIAPLMK